MKCKYFDERTTEVPVIGQTEPIKIREDICLIKMRDIEMKLRIYQTLFEKGLQGSMFTDDCPVARSSKWDECSFYEPSR